MKVLIDTQCWLWMNVSPERLSERTRAMLLSRSTERLLSVASIWEIAIKYQLGRLPLPLAPADYVPDRMRLTRTEPLAIGPSHALRAGSLPPLHRDPFDRMLVAQALSEIPASDSASILTSVPRLSGQSWLR